MGRTSGLAVFAAIFVLGSGLMLGANGERGLGLIYAGRVLAGLGVGGASNLAPIYISEIAPPAIRGRLVCMFELGWQVGGLVGFWINVSNLTNYENVLSRIICTDVGFSMVLVSMSNLGTLNGSFLLRFNLYLLGCSSWAPFGFMNHLDG